MLTITGPGRPAQQGPHIKTEADGSKTHYLGEVSMSLSSSQSKPQPQTKGE